MVKLRSYKELIVWQKSMRLVELVYKITSIFPIDERFGLVSQMRRAAVSIPSNIAEGYGRKSHKEYLQFYSISYGSALELETQTLLCQRLGYISDHILDEFSSLLSEVLKMLYTMINKDKGGSI